MRRRYEITFAEKSFFVHFLNERGTSIQFHFHTSYQLLPVAGNLRYCTTKDHILHKHLVTLDKKQFLMMK